MLFLLNNLYAAAWYDTSCWFNDKPELGVDITVYNEDGSFKSSLTHDNQNTIDTLVITDGEQIKIDFGRTTDDENNIQQERIFWNHNTKNNWVMNVQDSVSTITTIGTSSTNLTKFDFYSYLTGGLQSKPQYYNEHSDLISYNNGNPQFDFVKTFKPEAGNYELLLRVSDECGDSGIDEDFTFIDVVVNISNPVSQQNVCNGNLTITDSGIVDIGIASGCIQLNITQPDVTINLFKNEENTNIIKTFIRANTAQYPTINVLGSGLKFDFNMIDLNGGFTTSDNYYFNGYLPYVDFSEEDCFNMYNLESDNVFINSRCNIRFSDYANVTATVESLSYRTYIDNLYNSYVHLNGNDKPFQLFNNVVNNVLYMDDAYIEYRTNNAIGNHIYEITTLDYSTFNNGYANVFHFNSNFNDVISSSGYGNFINSRQVNGVWFGNAYINLDGNDIFTCPSTLNTVTYDGKTYKVCSEPVVIGTFQDMITMEEYNVSDYIIVTDSSVGGIMPTLPNLPEDPTEPNVPNKKPVAILDIDTSQEVTIGDTVCWDTSDSYDTDGSIVKKTVWVGDEVKNNLDSDCFTKNTPQVVTIKLEVEDNDGDRDDETIFVKFSNTALVCAGNTPPYLVLSNSLDVNPFYYLNMTVSDPDGDTDLTYAWTVNGQTIYGEDIYTNINYNQNVYGTVFDGCNITSDFMYIDVGKNHTDPIESIDVDLICNQNSLFAPTNVNCEVVKDLKGETLDTIYWTYDSSLQTQNEGASIFSRNVGDTSEHLITVTVVTLEGQIESDFYRFNLINAPTDGNDGGGGGGDTQPTKEICDIGYNPSSLEINEDGEIVKLTLVNNEDGSWSPDYFFVDVEDKDSVRDELSITNEIGTIQSGQSLDLGIVYNADVFDTNNVDATNIIRFISSNCEDVEVEINTIINNEQKILAFAENELFGGLGPLDLLQSTVLEKEQIPENNTFLENFKIWQLVLIVGLLFMFVLWEFKYSKNSTTHYTIKTLIFTLLTISISVLLVFGIRYLIEVL